RFFTEYERIDFAHKIGPLRLNDWASVIVFAGSVVALIATNRRRRTGDAGENDPGGDIASHGSRAENPTAS
ncbi:MAG: prolipoprotein diacylglyceryl transferase, partial [Acidimicrobiales bacterium]